MSAEESIVYSTTMEGPLRKTTTKQRADTLTALRGSEYDVKADGSFRKGKLGK